MQLIKKLFDKIFEILFLYCLYESTQYRCKFYLCLHLEFDCQCCRHLLLLCKHFNCLKWNKIIK